MPSPLANFFMKSLINSPLHSLLGENFAVITVTGRKTGKPITTPVNTLPVDGILTVLSQRDRTWWRNLRGGRMAQLRRAGQPFPQEHRDGVAKHTVPKHIRVAISN